jgi:hypothetical protein
MDWIGAIREKVRAGEYEFSKHAADVSILRTISVTEVRETLLNGEVIENYPFDKYGPSCLVLGRTDGGRILHVHCSHASRPLVKIVTMYEPDMAHWIDPRTRKR